LHGRTGYEDSRDVAQRRHLMRLWLQVPSWPDLPDNQGMHSPVDHPLWLRQRRPLMEGPVALSHGNDPPQGRTGELMEQRSPLRLQGGEGGAQREALEG